MWIPILNSPSVMSTILRSDKTRCGSPMKGHTRKIYIPLSSDKTGIEIGRRKQAYNNLYPT